MCCDASIIKLSFFLSDNETGRCLRELLLLNNVAVPNFHYQRAYLMDSLNSVTLSKLILLFIIMYVSL